MADETQIRQVRGPEIDQETLYQSVLIAKSGQDMSFSGLIRLIAAAHLFPNYVNGHCVVQHPSSSFDAP